jgi:hypothetical protein
VRQQHAAGFEVALQADFELAIGSELGGIEDGGLASGGDMFLAGAVAALAIYTFG